MIRFRILVKHQMNYVGKVGRKNLERDHLTLLDRCNGWVDPRIKVIQLPVRSVYACNGLMD